MRDAEGKPSDTFMITKEGELLGTYKYEKDPKLTPDQYLDILAKNLDTGEKMNFFMESMMQYVYDSPLDQIAGGNIDKFGMAMVGSDNFEKFSKNKVKLPSCSICPDMRLLSG